MPGVIFLDLSTRCGVAFPGPDPGLPLTTLWPLPKAKGSQEGGWEFGELFSSFRKSLTSMIAVAKPTVVGFEAPITIMGSNSPMRREATSQLVIEMLYGLSTVTQEATYEWLRREAWALNIQQVKKHITGNPRADKEAVIRAVQRLGIDVGDPPDDNRADAAAGWLCLSALVDPKFRPGKSARVAGDTPLFGAA